MENKYKKELESLQVNIDTLDHWLTEKNTFQAKKEKLKEEIASLTQQLKTDKKEGMIRINEAEFEKIKDVKKLTEEMDFKVKETQANLMALNDEQLQTQTRLTILQNHQLTTELDYQSKNTEQLVQTHDKMLKQIEVLKRNISLHKQVEKQLAKRAYKSQKIIAGLKTQVESLERQKNNMAKGRQTMAKPGAKARRGDQRQQSPSPNDLEGEELIDFLESKLEGIEKKLAKSQGSYENMQNNCLEIQDKLGRQKEKYKRAALMLTEFLEDLMSQKPNILKEQAKFAASQDEAAREAIDIERIQQTPIEDLERDDKVRVIFILLKQLQPFLSAQNLSAHAQFAGASMSRSMGNPITRNTMGTATTGSIEGMYGPNRTINVKQPLSNNFVNKSLQGGLPTQADSMSMGQPGANEMTIGAMTGEVQGAETIQQSGVNQVTDPNGVSLTNLLTNIKVQRPAD